MDKMQQLFEIATGNRQQTSIHEDLLKRNSKVNLEKARKERSLYKGTNKDPYSGFIKWFDNTQKFVDDHNRNEYWNLAEEMFPGSSEQARDFLNTHIRNKTRGDSYFEEAELRNLATKVPDWALKEIQPKLSFLQSQNSNKNLMKALNLYKTDLESRMEKLTQNPLDVDVPEEEHLKDFLKLESMNLLDVAKVENGRLVVANQKGIVIPAFQVKDRSDILGNKDPGTPQNNEMNIIYQAAPDILSKHINKNITKNKDIVSMTNKTASAAAINMLSSGNLNIANWGEAFSITTGMEPDLVLDKAIEGMIKKNPYLNDSDFIKNALEISNTYPDLINEIELRRSNVSVPPTTKT